MSYHYSSSQYAKRRPYFTILGIVSLLLIGMISLSLYIYREKFTDYINPLTLKVEHFKKWALSHDKKAGNKLEKPLPVKEKPVHFEFYSTLPTVELKVPINEKEEDKNVKPAILQPFVASRDELVKEFEEKIDETEAQD